MKRRKRVFPNSFVYYFILYILTKALLCVADVSHSVSSSMHLVIVDYIYKCLSPFDLL